VGFFYAENSSACKVNFLHKKSSRHEVDAGFFFIDLSSPKMTVQRSSSALHHLLAR
jgi:hypothetical protein